VAKDIFVHHVDRVSFRSRPREEANQWLRESHAKLQEKLEAYYGEDVPSQIELWGTEFQMPGDELPASDLWEFYCREPWRFTTDKGTANCYIEQFYAPLLKGLRADISILEIGVCTGGSVVLFSSFLPEAFVVGVDVTDQLLSIPRQGENYEIAIGDAYNAASVETFGKRRYDLIIDDGPHTPESQLFALKNYSKLLKPGGVLVVEDVQSREIAEAPSAQVPGCEIIDLRPVKGRYDDILVVYRRTD